MIKSIIYINYSPRIKYLQKIFNLWTIRPLALYTNFKEKSQ